MGDSVEAKIERIKADIERKNKEAQSLLNYLSEQQQLAKEEEEREEEDLKKQGVVVGQHIPSLPSRLDLDPTEVAKYETFAGTLLIAKDLVQQNRTNFLRRTGNLPISEAAEIKRDANAKYLAQQDPDVPHYLNQTKTAQLREERVAVRFADTLQDTVKVKRQNNTLDESKIALEKKPKSERPRNISMKEKLEHESVLHSINHKLNYLRNPRNDPKGVMKMLTKTKENVAGGSPDKDTAANASASVETGLRDSLDADSTAAPGGKSTKYGKKTIAIHDNPLFVCEPKIVLFQDYDIGNKYQRSITFRNVSAVSRTIHVLQPKNKALQLSPLKYPPNCANGVIAPGMCVTCTLTFAPTVLGDISDEIHVGTESGSTAVSIKAQREPPNLSIPSFINLGYCLIGDAQRSSLQCTNTGGAGRFEVVAEVQDELLEGRSLRIPPFTVYPTQFELRKGESVDLVFEYVPLNPGQSSRTFVIRCDNGQVREFTVLARSKEINITYSEVNGVPFTIHEADGVVAFKDITFPDVKVGSEVAQTITVINDTGLPVEYEWVWMDTNVKDKHLHSEGQKLIKKRMMEQRPITVQDSRAGTGRNPDQGHITGADLENSQANQSLLRSIKASMEGLGETKSAMSENSARHDAFEILPARGVIAGEGAGEFKILYTPTQALNSSLRAVMMVKSVPLASLPCPEQSDALARLSAEGHGSFVRFKSWLEELAKVGTVDKYKRANGSVSTEKGLISADVVAALVSNYAMQDSEVSIEAETGRIDEWLRRIMKHMYDFRKSASIADDDQSVEALGNMLSNDDKVRQEVISLYDWVPDKTAKPTVATPITLFYRVNEPDNIADGDDLPSPRQGGNYNNNDNDDSSVDEFNQLPRENILMYTDTEREILSEIWLDAGNVIKLIGPIVANILNEKVQHEAVEYLKDCSLNSYASNVHFTVTGIVAPHRVTVQPPCLEVGGTLAVGATWEGSVELTNTSPSPLELLLKVDELVVKRLSQTLHDDLFEEMQEVASEIMPNGPGSETLQHYVQLYVDNPRILLMPNTSTQVSFTVAVGALGRFSVAIPVRALNSTRSGDDVGMGSDTGSVLVEDIVVHVLTACPQVRFDSAEVDLGLLGVGQETATTLTFVNEGSVAAMFMMKPQIYLDTMVGAKRLGSVAAGGGSNTQREGSFSARSQQVPLSGRSNISRQSSIHSDDFSVADSTATSTDFKIELKNAIVTVEPTSGVIAPESSFTVTLTAKAGKQPQRIRGMLETRVFDVSGKIEAHRQYVNLRGEVQSPKVLLYPMQHGLGQVYVGRPVSFQVTLENICNLPTKFKFLRPGGASSLFKFTLSPLKGSLEAKEKLVVQGTFTALMPGLIDDVIACKMFGISLPLGIAVKALARGIQLECLSLSETDPLPLPLAGPEETQFPKGERAPEPRHTLPIELGNNVPLYQRRSGRLVLRNLSAIAAPFEVRVKKYQVVEKPKRIGTSSLASASVGAGESVGSSVVRRPQQQGRTDLVLAPHEDGINKFQSEAGQAYIGAEVDRREDRQFLHSGLGAAYALVEHTGVLAPWGVHEVGIFAYNDIPGCYDDDLEIHVTEGEAMRKFIVPVTMTVAGCPVVIESSTLGMTTTKPSSKDQASSHVVQQLLQLGQAPTEGAPLQRAFFVKNCGSKPGRIKWTVRGIAGKAYGPVQVQLTVDKTSGRVKTRMRFWEDIAKESPFQIEPRAAVLPPYGKQRFTVTLSKSSPFAVERAQLTASIAILENKDENDDGHSVHSQQPQPPNAGLTGATSSAALLLPPVPVGALKFSLQLLVEGSFVHPQLIVDKHTFTLPQSETVIGDHQALKLKAKATLLFAQGGKPSDVCYRLVEVTNPLETTVVINTSVDGPYLLKDADTGNATKSSSSKQIKTVGGPSSSIVSMASLGRVIQLLPHVCTSHFPYL